MSPPQAQAKALPAKAKEAAAAAPVRRDPRPLDPFVWKACAGNRVKIPAVGSKVYYFPEGHLEQSSSPPDFSAVPRTKPYFLCRVASVEYRADQDTDEVYTKLILDPWVPASPVISQDTAPNAAEDGKTAVAAYAKILTPSDANNGGGFSVPRFCADSIFPDLDFSSETPVQTLVMHDLLGNEWKFRHIYRGIPRRHLLTTGWSKFVNAKKLVAGDSVVFIRNSAGEVFVGIRRRNAGGVAVPSNAAEGEGFVRNGRGRVAAQAVIEAVRAAEAGDRAFEVEYYPMNRAAEFVVAEEEVAAAMEVAWVAGLNVRMGVETVDSVRVTWHQGTVERTVLAIEGPWALSPWRMLMIVWENPPLFETIHNVSPWQVQFQQGTPSIEPLYVPTGELRILQNPISGLDNTMMGRLSLSLLNYNASPAGMQGTRQEPNNSNQPSHSENISGSDSVQESTGAYTERSSPTSTLPYESLLTSNKEGLNDSGSPNKRARSMSFQLFGQVIVTKQPLGIDVVAVEQQEEAEGAIQSEDPSSALHAKATSPTSAALPTKASSPISPMPISEHEL